MDRVVVKTQDGDVTISRHIYGHFSEHLGRCIYGGYWVGGQSDIPNTRGIRNDITEALKRVTIPNLRWPGGCFADEYHWKDGIGPRGDRPKMINTHWGGITEDNSFGTHEFLDLCGQLGCEPYICGNVGSGTVRELSQWVEYCNSDGVSPMTDLRGKNGRASPWNVRYWGIGNESWGCGGNMTAEFYADNFLRYATYARNYGGIRPYRIACGANGDDYNWTRVLMEKAARCMDGLSLHYYTVPGEDWRQKGSAVEFTETEWYITMEKARFMETLVQKHGAIMDEFDPQRRIALIVDEWGTWFDQESGSVPGFLYQQNTLRDALVAGIHLNIFNNNAGRVRMANIAQTVNVLQALILTDGPRMILTPTYHVFEMYKVHHDALMLPVYVESQAAGNAPAISASASLDASGKTHISLTNSDPVKARQVHIDLRGYSSVQASGRIITSENMRDHNTFERGNTVGPEDFSGYTVSRGAVTAELPSKSVVTLELV